MSVVRRVAREAHAPAQFQRIQPSVKKKDGPEIHANARESEKILIRRPDLSLAADAASYFRAFAFISGHFVFLMVPLLE